MVFISQCIKFLVKEITEVQLQEGEPVHSKKNGQQHPQEGCIHISVSGTSSRQRKRSICH
jgi:hypothetical protein